MDRRSARRKDRRREPPRTRHHVHGHAAVGAARATVLTRASSFRHARSIWPQTARTIVVETASRRISMLERLIESGTRATARRHVVPSGVAAVAAHAAIIAGAVWATLAPAGAAGTEPIPVTIAWPFTEPPAPGRVRGRAGRVVIRLPIDFTLQRLR